VFYRAALATAPVRMMYRSSRDARLLAVDKEPGTIADALNCGVNLARFRYVAAVEPGSCSTPMRLLRALTAPLRNPATVVGATCHVEIVGDGLQRLRSIRSMMLSRLIWGTAPERSDRSTRSWSGAAMRSTQAGGFSSDARRSPSRHDGQGAIVHRDRFSRTGRAHGRHFWFSPVAPLAEVAARWRVGTPPRGRPWRRRWPVGASTRDMLARFVVTEVLTPFVQAWVVVAAVAGVRRELVAWVRRRACRPPFACGQAVVSCAALLMRSSLDVRARPARTAAPGASCASRIDPARRSDRVRPGLQVSSCSPERRDFNRPSENMEPVQPYESARTAGTQRDQPDS
jgi:hypothetical protein